MVRGVAMADDHRRHATQRFAEPVDRVEVLGPQFVVAHAEALLGCEAQHADLALVQVAVHVVGRPGRSRPAGRPSTASGGWRPC